MTALEMIQMYDLVEAEFRMLLLVVHDAPLDAPTRAGLEDALFAALDHASVDAQITALVGIRHLLASLRIVDNRAGKFQPGTTVKEQFNQ